MLAVLASTKFINAEFSWGKWNAEDVEGLQEPLNVVLNRAGTISNSITAVFWCGLSA
jgi:hypothetical protein